jgi:hypothetical protein
MKANFEFNGAKSITTGTLDTTGAAELVCEEFANVAASIAHNENTKALQEGASDGAAMQQAIDICHVATCMCPMTHWPLYSSSCHLYLREKSSVLSTRTTGRGSDIHAEPVLHIVL